MYLLDTCTVSDYVKVYSKKLNHTLTSHDPSYIYLSAITIEEIEFGLVKNEDAKKKLGGRINLFIETISEHHILPIDFSVAKLAGKIRAQLQSSGKIIGQYDILIAATAIANDKTLITSNTKHFRDIPLLNLEDWR
ncbi:MAG: PIN domain-containing protein [Legionellales bacterium]|nr:PIN domain-containing protein [Legionellales bacterium]